MRDRRFGTLEEEEKEEEEVLLSNFIHSLTVILFHVLPNLKNSSLID